MKKVLLSGAALLAMTAGAAQAEGLSLDLGGHFKGYGVYNDNDEVGGADLQDTAIRKETEVHFTGETTLDSGLTVGVHVEADVDADDNFATDEAYMYLSGGWGRVNFGEEDGAAYLLQVAAPSADSNIDGLRQYISTYDETGTGAGTGTAIDYANDIAQANNKLTYMTPVFNGFQVGASYTPSVDQDGNGTTAIGVNAGAGLEDGYELAARYEGAFEGVGMAFGAGYSDYSGETSGNDVDEWNVGLDLDFSGFGLGVVYTELDNDAVVNEVETLVVGADYQLGAYKLGASWLNQDSGTDLDRYTVGAGYSYGPGMSFRGSVSVIDNDNDVDSTQVSLGTQVNF